MITKELNETLDLLAQARAIYENEQTGKNLARIARLVSSLSDLVDDEWAAIERAAKLREFKASCFGL